MTPSLPPVEPGDAERLDALEAEAAEHEMQYGDRFDGLN